jgi:hypothetical protein
LVPFWIFLIGIRVSPDGSGELGLWVEFNCPICGRDLDDDKSLANFMVCNELSHGTLRFFTGDRCFFTSNEKVAEELVKKGKRVHVVDPQEFFAQR